MAATDTITSISGLAALSSAAASASALTDFSSNSPGQNVIANDPITDIRLLASLPANLGQNTDLSA